MNDDTHKPHTRTADEIRATLELALSTDVDQGIRSSLIETIIVVLTEDDD